jgi:hypothetical protein
MQLVYRFSIQILVFPILTLDILVIPELVFLTLVIILYSIALSPRKECVGYYTLLPLLLTTSRYILVENTLSLFSLLFLINPSAARI